MIYRIFSVYDSKVEAYMQPFFMKTKGEAVRGFTEAISDHSSPFSKYPEDFTLFELGSYDDSNAEFVMHSTPSSVGKAIEFVKSFS